VIPSIRKLTAAEREQRDAARAERYDELAAEIEMDERSEYNEQFGEAFRAKHPFKLDTVRMHTTICRRLHAEGHDYEESRAEV